MNKRLRILIALASIGVAAGHAAPAYGQWSALQQVLFRDLNYGLNPDILSFPQGGPLADFNDFFQRVEFDRLGQGYSYEFYRFFGPDTFGESNLIDLGAFKLDLSPDPGLGQSQFTGIHGRAGYKTSTIPEVFFLAETGTRAFNQFSGVSTFLPQPLNYTATLNTGVQDFEWEGNILIDASGTLNVLGFYDFDMRLVNIGSYTADGAFVEDEQVTDFDTGQINLSGNIALDAIASLFQADGSSGAAAVPRIFSAAAGKERTADELVAALKAGEKLTDEEVEFLIQQMFVQAIMDDPIGFFMNGLPTSIGLEELGISLEPTTSDPEQPVTPSDPVEQTPEPGTLLLFGVTAGLAVFIRKRGGFTNPAFPRAA